MPARKAPRVKAYHHVSPAIIDDVIEEGRIRVGAARLDPAIWHADCPDRIRDLIANAESSRRHTVNAVAAQALGDLVVEGVDALSAWQREVGARAVGSQTDFQCLDFLAGDLNYVFLSVDDWISWGRENPSGFVFDAETLLKRGALLRNMDFGPKYAYAVQEVIVMPWRDLGAAKRAILDVLAEVQKRGQMAGRDAIAYLRDTHEPGAVLARPLEVLWPGDLPVELAESAWKDGNEVTLGRAR